MNWVLVESMDEIPEAFAWRRHQILSYRSNPGTLAIRMASAPKVLVALVGSVDPDFVSFIQEEALSNPQRFAFLLDIDSESQEKVSELSSLLKANRIPRFNGRMISGIQKACNWIGL